MDSSTLALYSKMRKIHIISSFFFLTIFRRQRDQLPSKMCNISMLINCKNKMKTLSLFLFRAITIARKCFFCLKLENDIWGPDLKLGLASSINPINLIFGEKELPKNFCTITIYLFRARYTDHQVQDMRINKICWKY
jgi:hypothetical protein